MSRSRIKALLLERFPLCTKSGTFPVLTIPNIPEKQMKHMAKNLSVQEDIISICDTSLFGRGKNGIAFTEKAVYFKDSLSSVKKVYYSEDWQIGKDDAYATLGIAPSHVFFDNFALTDLIDELVRIAAEESEEEPEKEAPAEAGQGSPAPEAEPEPPAKPADDSDGDEDDDDDDDDDSPGFLDLLGIAMDVTDDPSR